MSLRDVKVGDVVVTTDVNRKGVARHPVTAIGRKYITTRGQQYEIATGNHADAQGRRYAFTEAQWARMEADSALRAAFRRLNAVPSLANLTDDEVRDLTAALTAAAEKMEKKP